MRYYRLIILTFLLVSATSCHYFRERGLFLNREKALESIRLANKRDAVQSKDTIKQVSDSTVRMPVVHDSVKVISPEIRVKDNPRKEFKIIIGSYSDRRNAVILAEKYRKQGYGTEILELRNRPNSLLVSISSFDTREKAEVQLKTIKANINSGAWIYSRSKE